MIGNYKEFKPTSWSIDNKTSMYMLAIILAIFGFISYATIPKEQIPEIKLTYVAVSTIYPGTSPKDMENFITRPLEKNMKSLEDMKTITSNSVQDFSMILVEFNAGTDIVEAKQRVKDAVDKTARDLPNDLTDDPTVAEIDFSDIPIMNINISGNYSLDNLKEYADLMQDRIEQVPEITRVDIVGALDREIQVNVDMYKMQAAMVTFRDIENAIKSENVTISGGNIDMEGMSRSVRVVGEFVNADVIKNITLTSSSGAIVRLSDIAEIKDSHKKAESYSRLFGKNVVTLNVIKKSGENLIHAADQINVILDDMKGTDLPKDLNIVISGDQSYFTKNILKELNNTIIIGFILVTIVLMFFMGLTNAIFVGFSVPLSMALAYVFLPVYGFTLNMLVMFSFIFALGIVVDDAIVVIENTHRIFKKTGMDIKNSAKAAAGEVFVPILSGTMTTLAPFIPLAFWPGVVGKFMYYIPITLITTLIASLLIAYLLNPVFAVSFMKPDEEEGEVRDRRKILKTGLIIFLISALFYIPGFAGMKFFMGLANLGVFIALSYVAHNLWMWKVLLKFQQRVIPGMLENYEKALRWALKGKRPKRLLWELIGLFVLSLFIFVWSKPNVLFFPEGDPMSIYVEIKMPIGTEVNVTDSVARVVESKVNKVLGENNPIVESVITNVAKNATSEMFASGDQANSNLARISINFVEFAKRHGQKTTPYVDKIREEVRNIAGAEITVNKESNGPPVGKPINIEVSGENLDELIATTDKLSRFIDSIGIDGIEDLKSDFETFKPELIVNIDRERANREGITTGQIGMELRTAITGNEVSKFREEEDQYPIQLRYSEYQRENIDRLMNLKITFMDMASGRLKSIPLSSVASIKYQNTYGGIKRKDLKRVITLSSNLLSGYNSNAVNQKIRQALPKFEKPESIEISITGEQEDQAENMVFLGKALLLSIFLVLFILVTQFNSKSKPVIILSEILFSIIGVILGFTLFNMDYSIIMSGMGIVALAGIVVRNGILLVEFTDRLKEGGMRTREAIVQGGKVRITPIVLTATATILGLIPLAIGFNINFATLLTDLSPQLHIGSDTKDFFGALAWTIIFGLSFATVLTLLFIPVMYKILWVAKINMWRRSHHRRLRREEREERRALRAR
ncbi:MAG TPA: efflux RND transporter permease subunit [Bacteroidales bacterium]|nr:efflux RND transporter permease subunit [Bacteroidales bacterium]